MWARRSLSIHRLSYSKFSKSVSTCLLQSMQQRHSVFWFGWKPFRETLKSKRVFWLTGLLQVVKLWELSFSLFYVLLCLQRERKSSGRNHFLNLSILKNREYHFQYIRAFICAYEQLITLSTPKLFWVNRKP